MILRGMWTLLCPDQLGPCRTTLAQYSCQVLRCSELLARVRGRWKGGVDWLSGEPHVATPPACRAAAPPHAPFSVLFDMYSRNCHNA